MRHDPARVLNLRVPPDLRPRLDALAGARQTTRHHVAVSALLRGVDALEAAAPEAPPRVAVAVAVALEAPATPPPVAPPAPPPPPPRAVVTSAPPAPPPSQLLERLQRAVRHVESFSGVGAFTPWRSGDPFAEGDDLPRVDARATVAGAVAEALTPGASGNLVSVALYRDATGAPRVTVRYAGRVCVEGARFDVAGRLYTAQGLSALVRVRTVAPEQLPQEPAAPRVVTLAGGAGAVALATNHRAEVALIAAGLRLNTAPDSMRRALEAPLTAAVAEVRSLRAQLAALPLAAAERAS